MTLKNKSKQSAFTIIELLIVVAIIALLAALLLLVFGKRIQILKSYDAVKKSDLQRLQTAFENYYSDNNCYPYPAQDILNQCESTTALSPYIPIIPCNPQTKAPYTAWAEIGDTCPQWFKIYTNLDNQNDPIISTLECTTGCGPGYSYNYGVTSSGINVSDTNGSPPGSPGRSYCSTASNCTTLPDNRQCPENLTFSGSNCHPLIPGGCNEDTICDPQPL